MTLIVVGIGVPVVTAEPREGADDKLNGDHQLLHSFFVLAYFWGVHHRSSDVRAVNTPLLG